MLTLREVAHVVRSKNAGPYIFTVDVVFRERMAFQAVVELNVLSVEAVAEAYGIRREDVLSVEQYPPANCIKVNIRRRIVSGGIGDSDVLGMQFHTPLADLEIEPRPLHAELCRLASGGVSDV